MNGCNTEVESFKELTLSSLDEIDDIARKIIDFAQELHVWIFDGDMGAGKTTLIKSICRILGVKDHISSPTYSLVNEYANNNLPVYHFDFYRIKSESEALDIGFEEYLDSGALCLIEWPSQVRGLLSLPLLEICLQVGDKGERKISLSKLSDSKI